MGSMYETCAISSLPIVSGDEVVLFLLEKKKHVYNEWASQSEADGWYKPISLPVYAEFTWDETFRVSESSYVREDMNNLSDREFFDQILRQSKFEGIDFMFMHRSMYELVLNDIRDREEIKGKFEKWANEFVTQAANDISSYSELEIMSYFMMLDVHFPSNKFVRFFAESMRDRDLLKQLVQTKDDLLLTRMVETTIFHYALSTIRKMWQPSVGRGSQAKEYFLMKKIAEATIEKEQQAKNKWLEENELGDNQDEDDITKTYLWYIG